MRTEQMQEIPAEDSHTQVEQANGDSKAIILARIYAMILSWPEEIAEVNEGIEEPNAESHLGKSDPKSEEAQNSTLTTE